MRYNINNNNFSNLLKKIREFLEASVYEINNLIKIDHKYCQMKVDLEMLKELIEEMKNEKIEELKGRTKDKNTI